MRIRMLVLLLMGGVVAWATVVDQEIDVQGEYLDVGIAPGEGGTLGHFAHRGAVGNFAGGDGLLQEGFGVASLYVPNRRLNEQLETLDSIVNRPVITYAYDCDGPNIRGLHVTRTMEPLPDQASLRVTWKVENRGNEAQWVAPWVRNDVAPGGSWDARDRLDCPTPEGIQRINRTAYHLAARNWAAATDPIEKITVYGVFNADQTHSFLTVWEPETALCGFQTAFVPRLFQPGTSWETVYRLNIVRGLSHVNFATDEFAVQIDYRDAGSLEVLIAAAKSISDTIIDARVLAADGRVWRLPRKRFTANPNTVVRCSYAWEAPREGAYDFLAELSQQEKRYPIGQDTGSPHGGIDAEFVVGAPSTAAFEPWTDAPYALKRSPRTVPRVMARSGEPAIWFESALEKVFREDVPEPKGEVNPAVHISLARNERESFQVVVRPPEGKDIEQVECRVHDLTSSRTDGHISADDIQVFNVAYHPVVVPTNFEGPTGEWPDALLPFQPFKAAGGQCTPVWFTVHAAADVSPGEYMGMLEVVAPAMEPAELWMEVTVQDFALPSRSALKTDFGFFPEGALGAVQRAGSKLGSTELFSRYLTNALAHRVTLRELAEFPEQSAGYATDLAGFAPQVKRLLERGISSLSVPVSLLDAPESLRQADAFVAEHRLGDRVFCQIASEPPSPVWPQALERIQTWKSIAPHIPVMATTAGLEPFLPDSLDIWGVHLQVFDTLNNEPVLKRIGAGKEVWWYVNYCPPRPYGNFFLDFAAIEHRILFWQAWVLGVRGFHYWAVNAVEPGQDPYLSQLDATPVNGNGVLVYPGSDGPVNSIRWEIIRDGIEDYDYLTILADRLRKARQAGGREGLVTQAEAALNLQEVVPDLVTFPRDPAKLAAKRDAIARAIVQLSGVAPQ